MLVLVVRSRPGPVCYDMGGNGGYFNRCMLGFRLYRSVLFSGR